MKRPAQSSRCVLGAWEEETTSPPAKHKEGTILARGPSNATRRQPPVGETPPDSHGGRRTVARGPTPATRAQRGNTVPHTHPLRGVLSRRSALGHWGLPPLAPGNGERKSPAPWPLPLCRGQHLLARTIQAMSPITAAILPGLVGIGSAPSEGLVFVELRHAWNELNMGAMCEFRYATPCTCRGAHAGTRAHFCGFHCSLSADNTCGRKIPWPIIFTSTARWVRRYRDRPSPNRRALYNTHRLLSCAALFRRMSCWLCPAR